MTDVDDRLSAGLGLSIWDQPLVFEDYPKVLGLDNAATLSLYSMDGDVLLGATWRSGDREASAGFTFDPDTAEEVAELLQEYATKARAGEPDEYH